MSAVTLAQEGYTVLLDAMLEDLVPVVHLYTNDPDIDDESTVEDFDELVADNYDPLTVKRWTASEMDRGQAFAAADTLTFSWIPNTDTLPVQGYYCTAGADGPLLWAWRRPGEPYTPSTGQEQLSVSVEARFPPEIPTPVLKSRRKG
jgi:hypothetical protein